jgi:hypothetical protein
MRVSAARLVALTCSVFLAAAACGGSPDEAAPLTQLPAPDVVLTPEEEQVWAPLPPDRSAIPVLLYHGIGPESDFANAEDASYGIDQDDFAKQMTMIAHAGYEAADLETFVRFVQGESVDLPPRPLLLTFDDARADSWTGADAVLEELGFTAVMFVDVGRVDGGDPECLTWDELETVQDSGHWELQLHSGEGHQQIQYGPALTTSARTTPTRRRARTSTIGRSGCSRTSSGVRRRSPTTCRATSRRPSRCRTAAR